MLDEPFAGIDPVTVQSIQEIIQKLRQRGIAILITDHAAREILQTVDRCYVISKGAVLCDGSPESVMQHPDVRREYLGDIVADEQLSAQLTSASNTLAETRESPATVVQPADTSIVHSESSAPHKPKRPHMLRRRRRVETTEATAVESSEQPATPARRPRRRPRRTDV